MRARSLVLVLALLATMLIGLGDAAFADRVGKPFRGPKERSQAGSGQEDTGEAPVEETTEETNEQEENTGVPDSGQTQGPSGKAAKIDGPILWAWWWEHNKDRYIARMTEPGRVHAGSAYYWFGHGAKYPPREIVPVSGKSRHRAVFPALRRRLGDNDARVRAEACIALGRVGFVRAPKKKSSKGKGKGKGENKDEAAKAKGKDDADKQSENLVVRELIKAYEKPNEQKEVKASALLGLGMTRSEDAAAYLMRRIGGMKTAHDKAHAYIALGLVRHLPAIEMLLDALPRNARRTAPDDQIAAIHAIGLFGPDGDVIAILNKKGGVARLEKLIDARAKDTRVTGQAVVALGRLQQGQKAVIEAFKSKTNAIQWNSLLALSNYSNDEKQAEETFKFLSKTGFKSGKGQHKSFSVLALGELASRLDENSKTRAKILKFIKRDCIKGTRDRYIRAVASIAVGVARDETAIPLVGALLTDTTADHWVIGAACVSLGLLRATDYGEAIRKNVLDTKKWDDDAHGYALLGLALMGDTTHLSEILKQRSSNSRGIARQVGLAIGILGDKRNISSLSGFFRRKWDNKRLLPVSNAAYGLSWIKDQRSVRRLVNLTTSNDADVRGMATVALGYVGSIDRVSPLTRSFENTSHRNGFGGWELLAAIANIL